MTKENPVADLKDGTRVRVTVEGVVDGSGVTVNANTYLYHNLLCSAEIEVLKTPVQVGEFFVSERDKAKFIGLALSEGTYTVVRGSDLHSTGRVLNYNISKLHENGFKAITHEEVQALLAGTDEAKTTMNAGW